MSERYVTLLGAEQVQSAANSMQDAASRMQRAADTIADALDRHRSFMEDWLVRFEAVQASGEGAK